MRINRLEKRSIDWAHRVKVMVDRPRTKLLDERCQPGWLREPEDILVRGRRSLRDTQDDAFGENDLALLEMRRGETADMKLNRPRNFVV